MRTALLALVLAAVVGACALPAAAADGLATPTPDPAATATATPDPAPTATATPDPAATATPDPAATGTPDPGATPTATPDPAATATPTPEPTATPVPPDVLVPLVPVTGFWSTERSITRTGLAAAIAGTGAHPRPVYVPAADLPALARALGVTPGSNVRATTPALVLDRVRANGAALGVLRPEDVMSRVRALAVNGASLFGAARRRTLTGWPLLVNEGPSGVPSSFDPATTWTIVAGGDVMLDRSVYKRAILEGRGVRYPWNGGRAVVTRRFCCGWPGMLLVKARRVSDAGGVRRFLREADVAVVNLEGPVPNRHVYRLFGLKFSMDKRLLAGVKDAGIDAVSLANNHVLNAGRSGLLQTLDNVADAGLKRFGAGATLSAARRPAWFTVAGVKVAILGYNDIGPAAPAGVTRPGAAPLSTTALRSDIARARRQGAGVVIVMPHFGREYQDGVTARQRTIVAAAFSAGADLVLGNHSHWAGPIGWGTRGRLAVYSMGDLLFDLNHDERTQEAFLVETTFVGRRVAQVTLVPTIIVDQAQLNILAPSGGGTRLLRQVEAASKRIGTR